MSEFLDWLKNKEDRTKVNYKKEKAKAFERSGGRCEVEMNGSRCMSKNNLEPHHLVSRRRGVGDARLHKAKNLLIACHACHRKITDKVGDYVKYVLSEFPKR